MLFWVFVLFCILTKVFVSTGVVSVPKYYEWDSSSSKFVAKSTELSPDSPSLQEGFQSKVTQERFSLHSQSTQDWMVLTIFNDTNDRYFVDLAANDWKDLSNTYAIEQYNMWRGICIEPDPSYLVDLLSQRRCQVFVNPVSESIGQKVKFNFDQLFGGIVGEEFDNKANVSTNVVELTTVTLDSILDHAEAPRVIDYLSLDVEGAEYHVLSNFRFDKYTFLSLSIDRPSAKLHHFLTSHGYRFVRALSVFGETFYLHHSMPNFEGLMGQYHQERVTRGWMTDKEAHYLLKPEWKGHYIEHINTH